MQREACAHSSDSHSTWKQDCFPWQVSGAPLPSAHSYKGRLREFRFNDTNGFA